MDTHMYRHIDGHTNIVYKVQTISLTDRPMNCKYTIANVYKCIKTAETTTSVQ